MSNANDRDEIRLGLVSTTLDDGTPAVGVTEVSTGREIADLLSCVVKSSSIGTVATLEVRITSLAEPPAPQPEDEALARASRSQREVIDRLHARTVSAAVAWLREHPSSTLDEFVTSPVVQGAVLGNRRVVVSKLRARWWSEALAMSADAMSADASGKEPTT